MIKTKIENSGKVIYILYFNILIDYRENYIGAISVDVFGFEIRQLKANDVATNHEAVTTIKRNK